MALLSFAARVHGISVSMATVDTAWISAGSGLVGALVGASAALGGKWIDAHHARKGEKRRQTGELLAQFLEVTDRMWRLNEEADDISRDMGQFPVGEWRHPDVEESEVTDSEHLDRRRQLRETYQRAREANAEAGVLLGRMQLLALSVANSAEDLRQASSFYSHRNEPEVTTTRKKALDAYMKAASPLATS